MRIWRVHYLSWIWKRIMGNFLTAYWNLLRLSLRLRSILIWFELTWLHCIRRIAIHVWPTWHALHSLHTRRHRIVWILWDRPHGIHGHRHRVVRWIIRRLHGEGMPILSCTRGLILAKRLGLWLRLICILFFLIHILSKIYNKLWEKLQPIIFEIPYEYKN